MPSSEQTAPGPLWYKKITKKPAPRRSKMAIPDPPKAGSPFCALWTGGWNPKTPKINNFFIPEITLRGGYRQTEQAATPTPIRHLSGRVPHPKIRRGAPVPAHAPGRRLCALPPIRHLVVRVRRFTCRMRHMCSPFGSVK